MRFEFVAMSLYLFCCQCLCGAVQLEVSAFEDVLSINIYAFRESTNKYL